MIFLCNFYFTIIKIIFNISNSMIFLLTLNMYYFLIINYFTIIFIFIFVLISNILKIIFIYKIYILEKKRISIILFNNILSQFITIILQSQYM